MMLTRIGGVNRTLLTRRHVICERVGPATALRRSAVLSDTRTRGSRLSKLVTTALTHHQRAYHDYTKHYRSGNPLSRFIGPQVGRFHPIAAVVVGMVGLASKLFLAIFTRTAVLHADRLRRHVYGRSRVEAGAGKGVVTVLNHTSTMDDPVLWGVLPLWVLLSHRRNRWALAAQDICYTNPVAQWFFSFGQSLPVVRGGGIVQPPMNHAVDILDAGGWLNIYAEGRVNEFPPELLPFKWGVARLIMDAREPPVVLPIYHEGMNEVKPYHSTFPRYGQRVIINIGEPVDLKPHLDAWTALQVKLAAYDNDFKTDKDRNTFDDEDDDDDDDVVVARRLKHLHELREVIALRIAITRTIRESVDRLRLEVADFKRGERKVSE